MAVANFSQYAGTSLPKNGYRVPYTGTTLSKGHGDLFQMLFSQEFTPKQVRYVEHTVGARTPPTYRANFKPKCKGTTVRKDVRFA